MSLLGTCSIVNASATNLQIKYELTNRSDTTVYVCHYYSPLENLKNSHVFSVYNNTERFPLKYSGKMVTRLPPTAENYVKIEPNETVSNIVDMCPSYQLAPNQNYSITPTTNLHVIDDLSDLDSVVSIQCTANKLSVTTI